ncbi:MAG: alpha/beta hydrolase [Holophagaceae bacterium]|nr:alpha/beta hydrolase [Holophagaceae bacterium]
MRRLLLPLILLATCLGAAPRAIQRELLKIPTRPGVIQPALLLTEGTTPKAVALLFPGGSGKQSLLRRPVEVVLGARGNFLVRSAEQLLTPELAVLILDCPSDTAEGMNDAFRISDEHAADVRAVLGALRARFQGVKLHLLGTSRGTVSAAYVAQELGPAVDGVVLSSSVFRASGNNLGLSLFRFERLKTPLLLVHHAEDGCPFCPYSQARSLADKAPLITVRGGLEPESGPCDPLANHGFFGREAAVVQAIRSWILGLPFEREIP